MPFELSLPQKFRHGRWKVKILEKEIREHPHVTVLRKTDKWRINLRTGNFMDPKPDPGEVPEKLLEYIKGEKAWKQLCDEWDKKYPKNPVSGEKETGDEQDDDTNR